MPGSGLDKCCSHLYAGPPSCRKVSAKRVQLAVRRSRFTKARNKGSSNRFASVKPTSSVRPYLSDTDNRQPRELFPLALFR